jgi:hypothetical protein
MCWRVWGRRGVLGVDGVFGVLWVWVLMGVDGEAIVKAK